MGLGVRVSKVKKMELWAFKEDPSQINHLPNLTKSCPHPHIENGGCAVYIFYIHILIDEYREDRKFRGWGSSLIMGKV